MVLKSLKLSLRTTCGSLTKTNMRSDWERIIIIAGAISILASISCATWRRWFDYPKLSDSDKTELMRLTIEKLIEHEEAPFYSILLDTGDVIVAKWNIRQEILPQVENINLKVMSIRDIEERSDQKGPYMFLIFSLHARDWDRAYIFSMARWAIPEEHIITDDYSESRICLIFRKDSGKWIWKEMYYPESPHECLQDL